VCFGCMQVITADTVIAYITHDELPNILSVSSRHGAKRRGGLYVSKSGRNTAHIGSRLPVLVRRLLASHRSHDRIAAAAAACSVYAASVNSWRAAGAGLITADHLYNRLRLRPLVCTQSESEVRLKTTGDRRVATTGDHKIRDHRAKY